MANRQGDVDLCFAQVPPPVRTLAWLGSTVIQCSHQIESILKRDNRSWPARRKELCLVAQPRCLVDRALHYTDHCTIPATEDFSPAMAMVSVATTHGGPPASSRAYSSAPPLHNRPVLLQAAHSSPLSCYDDACRNHSLPAAKQHLASHHRTPATEQHPTSHHSELHCHSLLIPQQAQPAVQPYYTQ